MLIQDATKTHATKWVEAERELAIREFSEWHWPIEGFQPVVDTFAPQTNKELTSEKVDPRP